MYFSSSFYGDMALVGNLTIKLSKDIMAQVTGLPQQGERYFKTKQCQDKSWTHFYTDREHHMLTGRKGFQEAS